MKPIHIVGGGLAGSEAAWQNTNLGSTWATVAVNSAGFLGRYPSALKYKKNVRQWSVNPETVYGMTPVKYEDTQNGDTRVGFVADLLQRRLDPRLRLPGR